jgi:ATP-dependent RNA helicase DeaD
MNPEIFSVIFCRTKRDTQQIAEKLIEDGYNAAALHGDLSQAQRDAVMKSFRGRQIQMLVATDVAARGIDVDDVTHVINYQLPDEVETYTHRSGRTGRAGKTGTSMIIITKSELRKIGQIERIMKNKFIEKAIPSGSDICETQLIHLANKIKNVEVDAEIDQYLPAINEVLADLSKEDVIKKLVSLEFNRFISYYRNSRDLTSQVSDRDRKSAATVPTEGAVRYFINIGQKDNFDWMSLKDFLRDTLELGRDDLFKVDVKEGFSFFNTDAEHADKVMSVLNGYEHNGRRINVEISKNDGTSNTRRRDHNGRGGDRKPFERRGERNDRAPRSDRGDRGGERRNDRGSERRSDRGSERRDDRAPRNERRPSTTTRRSTAETTTSRRRS